MLSKVRACAPGPLRKRVDSAGPRRIICWRHLQEFVALGEACAEGLHAGAPRRLRTLARPSAALDACMPVEAVSRRSHGRVCTGSAALRHIACCLDCRLDARAAASVLTCSRCDTYAASAGVHLPLRALLRQRRRVGNRRNRRYAHVRGWACMRACARVGALAARPVWIAMCAAPGSSLVCFCARVFAGLGVQASGVVAFACIHTSSRAYASRAHARRTPYPALLLFELPAA